MNPERFISEERFPLSHKVFKMNKEESDKYIDSLSSSEKESFTIEVVTLHKIMVDTLSPFMSVMGKLSEVFSHISKSKEFQEMVGKNNLDK